MRADLSTDEQRQAFRSMRRTKFTSKRIRFGSWELDIFGNYDMFDLMRRYHPIYQWIVMFRTIRADLSTDEQRQAFRCMRATKFTGKGDTIRFMRAWKIYGSTIRLIWWELINSWTNSDVSVHESWSLQGAWGLMCKRILGMNKDVSFHESRANHGLTSLFPLFELELFHKHTHTIQFIKSLEIDV